MVVTEVNAFSACHSAVFKPAEKTYEFPLGIAYISAALKQAGEQVFCLNLNETQEPVEIAVAQAVNDFDPDVCGSGTLSPFLKNVKEVFTASRKAKANIVNVVGGGVFSGDPELAKNTLDIDIGVFGEGEEAIVEIAKALEDGQDLTAIQGLLVKCGDDRWIKTEARKSIRNLDDIPWPDMASFGLAGHIDNQTTGDSYLLHPEDQPRAVSMIASRSCPYSCTFCFHPIGRVYRERGLDDFFAELDHYVETYNINLVAILDELFAVKKERLRAFCRRIKPYGLKWTVQLHVSAADPDVLDMMKEAGCVYISYGLESMAPDVLKSMQKKATVEQIERALKLTRERQIGIQGNFIFGDPAETVESAATTIDWWAKNRAYMANLSVIQLYPGTPIYNQAMASGRFFKNSNTMIDPLQNVTSIDDETVVKMREFLQVFDQTLLWPAKILSFKESKKSTKPGGKLTISIGCAPIARRKTATVTFCWIRPSTTLPSGSHADIATHARIFKILHNRFGGTTPWRQNLKRRTLFAIRQLQAATSLCCVKQSNCIGTSRWNPIIQGKPTAQKRSSRRRQRWPVFTRN